MESGAELDQRRDAAVDLHGAARRLRDAGDQLERRALAGPVAADDAVASRPCGTVNDTSVQRRERLVGLQIAQDAALQQRALQRRELPAAVAAVDLRDVDCSSIARRHHRPPRTSRAADRTASSRPGTRTDRARAPSASSQLPVPDRAREEQDLLVRDRQVGERIQVEQPLVRRRRSSCDHG